VSKRGGSRFESGRSSHWHKTKNPNHPAVLRLLEEDWNGLIARAPRTPLSFAGATIDLPSITGSQVATAKRTCLVLTTG
jgi:hypothetical protein